VLIFPVCCLRSLSNISYFSAVALFFTFAAIIMILIITIKIAGMPPSEVNDDLHIPLTDEDRNYVYFNPIMIPVFCATINSLFEGN